MPSAASSATRCTPWCFPMSNEPLTPLLPGATLGMLGGGQLGRMFTIAARTMGYRVAVLDPDANSPAGQLADIHLHASYSDPDAIRELASLAGAVTTEFENVPADTLIELARHCRAAPSADAVAVVQDRIREKRWLAANGFATAPFAVVETPDAVAAALADTGAPALLKVARLGYDGKGQARCDNEADAHRAFAGFGGQPCVLERLVDLAMEVSVVLARDDGGRMTCFPVAENRHANGILDVSIVPARITETLAHSALAMAQRVADRLGYVGVIGVEFFITRDGRLLINEIAPRPHNSAHFTLDACATDQFEQQVRILAGLPAGDARLFTPVVMVNLLGDRWHDGGPHWARLLAHPNVKLHLYGKEAARPGRKMGHFNVLDSDLARALALAEHLREAV